MGPVPLALVYQLTVPEPPPVITPLALVRLKTACPPALSQALRLVEKACGAVSKVSVTAAGAETQPLLVTVAYTVAVPLIKAAGFGIGLVAAALENQLTVPVPPLTVILREVRLNAACPEPLSQAWAEAALAVGAGLTVRVTGTGFEPQPLAVAATAYTVVEPVVKAVGLGTGLVAAALV